MLDSGLYYLPDVRECISKYLPSPEEVKMFVIVRTALSGNFQLYPAPKLSYIPEHRQLLNS